MNHLRIFWRGLNTVSPSGEFVRDLGLMLGIAIVVAGIVVFTELLTLGIMYVTGMAREPATFIALTPPWIAMLAYWIYDKGLDVESNNHNQE